MRLFRSPRSAAKAVSSCFRIEAAWPRDCAAEGEHCRRSPSLIEAGTEFERRNAESLPDSIPRTASITCGCSSRSPPTASPSAACFTWRATPWAALPIPDSGPRPDAGRQAAEQLLHLVGAMARQSADRRPEQLLMISCRSQATAPRDEVRPENALVAGLLPTVSHELPWLSCPPCRPRRLRGSTSIWHRRRMSWLPGRRTVRSHTGKAGGWFLGWKQSTGSPFRRRDLADPARRHVPADRWTGRDRSRGCRLALARAPGPSPLTGPHAAAAGNRRDKPRQEQHAESGPNRSISIGWGSWARFAMNRSMSATRARSDGRWAWLNPTGVAGLTASSTWPAYVTSAPSRTKLPPEPSRTRCGRRWRVHWCSTG